MIAGDGGPALADEAVARRLKALACTAPLHGLDTRKAHLEWLDAGRYQMAEIGLQAIDQVTLAMDFDHGADQEQVVRRLTPFIAAQAPERSAGEHRGVGAWVVENLINVGSVDRGFQADYGTFDGQGRYVRRRFDFKLLVELAAPDGRVYLRATDEAINVLVGALDTDVESAQVAAEVKLENLIRRGRLGDARLAAEQARYRTVQYAEALRHKLDATQRDVRSVDWLSSVPELLEEALAHIESRYRAETAILSHIADARDDTAEPERRKQAAELVVIVKECIGRHTQLQARLQEAGQLFRAEQNRQQFAGRARRSAVDVFGQLLRPCLDLGVAEAVSPAAGFFGAGAGVRVPSVPSLGGLVETLLVPSVERDPLGAAMPEPDLMALDQDRYTEEQWQRADELLRLPQVGRRLSGLLAEARELDPELPGLVALRVLHAVGTTLATTRGQHDQGVCLAVDDGEVLDDPEFGGSDLLVTVAELGALAEEDVA
ncbi:hypothetical protein GCM10023321_72370 [Pseudonocardia eucalypti]|uniref:Uncharacterized protein n=1 Tax=Pseudonocardia eucalypti TaxID=648755 RepID=A0ABP9R6X2_9PSEU|nr:hypothetical protein [Pseudonocardia eucalypti]